MKKLYIQPCSVCCRLEPVRVMSDSNLTGDDSHESIPGNIDHDEEDVDSEINSYRTNIWED